MENGELLIPVGGYLTRIVGYTSFIDLMPKEKRQYYMVESAYVKLHDSEAILLMEDFTPIDGNKTLPGEEVENAVVCSVVGYPGKKSKSKGDLLSSEFFS